MEKYVAVVGSCMIDFMSYVPQLPKRGETLHGRKFLTGFGGKGANQCVAVAKLGGKTKFVARVGDDIWGKEYIEVLDKLHVDRTHVQITDQIHTGAAQIAVEDSTGENQIVIVAGANSLLCPDDIIGAENVISSATVLVCQLENPVETIIAALKICKGVSILNAAPALTECDPLLLTLPTIFCVNETEAATFTGKSVETVSDGEEAIKELLNRGCNTVILTLGPRGCLLGSRDRTNVAHLKTVEKTAIDTTGAGDAFVGCLAYLLTYHKDNYSLEMCCEIANKVAAESVLALGTQSSFADKSVLEKILSEHPPKKGANCASGGTA